MKIQYFALLVVLVMLAINAGGCNGNEDHHDYSGVISTAMQNRRQAYKAATTERANRGNTVFQVSLAAFAAGMRKLDVSACPSDFRDAWDNYIKTVEDRMPKEPIVRYTAMALAGGGAGRGQWDVPLDYNGMEFRGPWEQLNDAAEKYKAP